MKDVWFANDTPFTETDRGSFVSATALGLVDAGMVAVPDQIVVNGYSYSFRSAHPALLLYRRDHDGVTLTVNLK